MTSGNKLEKDEQQWRLGGRINIKIDLIELDCEGLSSNEQIQNKLSGRILRMQY
jgi:hypothetical protein